MDLWVEGSRLEELYYWTAQVNIIETRKFRVRDDFPGLLIVIRGYSL